MPIYVYDIPTYDPSRKDDESYWNPDRFAAAMDASLQRQGVAEGYRRTLIQQHVGMADYLLRAGRGQSGSAMLERAAVNGRKGGRPKKFDRDALRCLAREIRDKRPSLGLDGIAEEIASSEDHLKAISSNVEDPPTVGTIRTALKSL